MNEALTDNIDGVQRVGSFIETTMGPYGKDKLIMRKDGNFDGYYNVTNQAGFLLRRSSFQSFAGELVTDLATAQENQYGDGTAMVVLVASRILSEVEPLLEQGLHQTRVIEGIQDAIQFVQASVREQSIEVGTEDTRVLEGVVGTSLNGTVSETLFEDLDRILVEHVRSVSQSDALDVVEDSLHTECLKSESVSASEAFRGALLKKSLAGHYTPSRIDSATVATVTQGFARQRTLEEPLEVEGPSSGKRTVQYRTDPAGAESLHEQELDLVTDRIEPLRRAGVDIVFVEDRVEEEVVAAFNAHDIAVVRNVQIDLIERVSAATGSTIHTHVGDFAEGDVGSADQIEFRDVNGQDLISVRDRDADTLAVEIQGSSRKIGWEIQRNVRSALRTLQATLRCGSVVPGGGAIEAAIACDLRENRHDSALGEALVATAVSEALESVPVALAKNGGVNGPDARIRVRNRHASGRNTVGFCGGSRRIGDVTDECVFEPTEAKLNCLAMVAEVCSMILRIDEIVPQESAESD